MNTNETIGIIGATSPVGQELLKKLGASGTPVVAFSRRKAESSEGNVRWIKLTQDESLPELAARVGQITRWIVVSHIWVTNEYAELFAGTSTKRVVCISSTSQFTKTTSSNAYEEALVDKLRSGEARVAAWAKEHDIGWTIVRPTLIYGNGNDRNLSEIAHLIRKLGFFPILGKANGRRQPVHVADVAQACIQALGSEAAANKAYNISGGEVLTYKEMVRRVFIAMHKPVRFISIPSLVFSIALSGLHLIPRYKNWNGEMVRRMNQDMVFDHDDASRDFAFNPRPFTLGDIDVNN